MHVTVWDETAIPDPEPVVLVHGSQTWGTDSVGGYAAQRPLATSYRLLVVDRRGYGASPDVERSDYDRDADDVVALLDRGAHLVGHSYGGVVALLAASRAPDRVRSLTLIEPGAYAMALEDPEVAEALRRQRAALAAMPPGLTAHQFLRASHVGVGLPMPDPTPERLRAAATAMAERPCTEAVADLRPIADANWPKLVVTGDWSTAPETYRAYGGAPLGACARVVAGKIGAVLRVVSAADHLPHVQQPEAVNRLLAWQWSGGDESRTR